MLEIKMINGDIFNGDIVYRESAVLQSYSALRLCADGEFIILREASGQQRMLNRFLIEYVFDSTQS